MNEIEENQSKHLTQGIVSKYAEKTTAINDINKHLEEIKALLSTELTDDDIVQYNNDVNDRVQKIADIQSGIHDLFTEDIDGRKKELSTKENGIYEKIKEVVEKFHNMWQQDRDQLGTYNSLQYIDGDEELNRNFSKIQENKETADNIHSDIESRYAQFDVPDNWDEKHILVERIEELTEQEENLYTQMQDIHQRTAEKLLKIIDDRRVAYEAEKKQAEAEQQRQAAIDAQNLLLNNNQTPKSGTYDNSTNVGNNTVPQINDSAPTYGPAPNILTTPSVSGKITTQYDRNKQTTEPTVRHSGGLLTPIDDDAPVVNGNSSVSGTIRIK